MVAGRGKSRECLVYRTLNIFLNAKTNMSDKEKHHGPNGFVMGALLGGALVYLVGTPKGRRILKEISEHGIEFLEKVESIEDLANLEWDDLEQDDEYFVEDKPIRASSASTPSVRRSASSRRFFRGVKKSK